VPVRVVNDVGVPWETVVLDPVFVVSEVAPPVEIPVEPLPLAVVLVPVTVPAEEVPETLEAVDVVLDPACVFVVGRLVDVAVVVVLPDPVAENEAEVL
jgi:hypothetical protein